MAYKQWIALKIRNRLRKGDIRVKEARLESKDNEISANEVNKTVVPPQGQGLVSSCGRSDAAIGTEGYLTFYEWDGEHETKICRVYWSAPWGAHPNVFDPLDWDPHTSDYSIHHDPVQQDSTIGNMEFVIAKLA